MCRQILFVLICLISQVCTGFAQTSYPMVMGISPVSAQVGQSSEHVIQARYSLKDTYQIFISGSGVTGEVVADPNAKPNNDQNLKVKFTVTPEALPGVREVRVVTPRGPSTIGQLVVVRDPVHAESKPNDTLETAFEVPLPATICGAFEKGEDVDYYKFHVEAGESLSFHVYCGRLEDKIHDLQLHADPILTLKNDRGVSLATAENDFYADPCLRYRFETAGDYYVEIRDVRYQGNPYWHYSMEINSRPFAQAVHPIGIAKGSDQQIEVVGFHIPALSPVLKVPMEQSPGPMSVGVPMGDAITNPVLVYVSDLPTVVEAGENQQFTIPATISGRIEQPEDLDTFQFEAKKGDSFQFELIARRLGSNLDSVLRIVNAQGASLLEIDDSRLDQLNSADSLIENWVAPADGKYGIEVRDVQGRGGPEFVYALTVRPTSPRFTLRLDTDKTLLVPGGYSTIFARVERKHGFAGEVQLEIAGLPEGVSAECGKILATGTDGCIILKAEPGAKLNASNITVTGRGQHPQGADKPPLELSAAATPLQEIYFPGGGRGHFPVESHCVAVCQGLDILEVRLSATEIQLKPGESQKIEVEIVRNPEFKQNVTLDVIYQHLGSIYGNTLPPGVTLNDKESQTLLTGGATKGAIVLQAAANAAPVEKQLVSVMGHVSINFVMKTNYAAPPLRITVLPK